MIGMQGIIGPNEALQASTLPNHPTPGAVEVIHYERESGPGSQET